MCQTNATYRRSESAAASRILDSHGVVLGTRMQGTKRGLVSDSGSLIGGSESQCTFITGSLCRLPALVGTVALPCH
jgi:hypothetical protein